jgi:two-component system OmpR family sensor kinase
MAEMRAVTLVVRGTERPAIVNAVPGAIEQILDNVLDNALAVSPDGAEVSVEVLHGAGEYRLVVSDRGPGLSDHDKDRALRRFWRGDTSTPGTGLGLAIAHALARVVSRSCSRSERRSTMPRETLELCPLMEDR